MTYQGEAPGLNPEYYPIFQALPSLTGLLQSGFFPPAFVAGSTLASPYG